ARFRSFPEQITASPNRTATFPSGTSSCRFSSSYKPGVCVPIAVDTTPTHCPYCALQCAMHVGGTSVSPEIAGNAKFPVNKGGLCIRGWTAGAALAHGERLTTPLVRNSGGALEPASWDDALDRVAERFTALQSASGRDIVGVFGGGSLTNEKAY